MFRTRDLAVKRRTQLGNALPGHLAEYGWVAPHGSAHLAMLADLLEVGEIGQTLPEAARLMFAMIALLEGYAVNRLSTYRPAVISRPTRHIVDYGQLRYQVVATHDQMLDIAHDRGMQEMAFGEGLNRPPSCVRIFFEKDAVVAAA